MKSPLGPASGAGPQAPEPGPVAVAPRRPDPNPAPASPPIPRRAFGWPRVRPIGPRQQPATTARLAARLPDLIGVEGGREAIERRLAELSVIVVGCGAVGCVIAAALARLQPGRMVLVDPKPISATTALTSLRFSPGQVGRGKALATARDCAAAAPEAEVFACAGPAQALPLSVWLAANLVLLATDNVSAKAYVGECCHRLGVTLITANVHGASLVSQVAVFSNAGPDTPCPACSFSQEEWRLAAAEVAFSCDGGGVSWPGGNAAPTRSTAHLCGLAGTLAVNQVLRWLLDLGRPVTDTVLEHCGVSRQVTLPLARRPDCRCDHSRWDRVALAQDPVRLAFDDLTGAAGLQPDRPQLWATVDGRDFVELGHCGCSAGGEGRLVHRFVSTRNRSPRAAGMVVAPGVTGEVCPACREPIRAAAFHQHPRVTAGLLGARRHWSFRRLGARPGDTILVGDGDRTVIVQQRRTGPEGRTG